MNESTARIIKYGIIFVVLGVTFQQATARAKNIGIAEANLAAAEVQDSIVDVLTARADTSDARADSAELAAVQRAVKDSVIIAGLEETIVKDSTAADSIAGDLEARLEEVDPELAAEFEEFRTTSTRVLVASREETRVEREAKEAAERRALLWKKSSEDKDPIIETQAEQIRSLEAATAAALSAASPGLWPRLQADWWVAAVGFGIGVIATR